jgi:hypothetical protein
VLEFCRGFDWLVKFTVAAATCLCRPSTVNRDLVSGAKFIAPRAVASRLVMP